MSKKLTSYGGSCWMNGQLNKSSCQVFNASTFIFSPFIPKCWEKIKFKYISVYEFKSYFRISRTNLLTISFSMLKLNFDNIRHQLQVQHTSQTTQRHQKWLFQESTAQRNILKISPPNIPFSSLLSSDGCFISIKINIWH